MCIETIAIPIGWQAERQGLYMIVTGPFCVYDQNGSMKLHVPGYIAAKPGSALDIYLYDPPGFLKKHKHGCCLQLLRPNEKWFKLHFTKPAYDFVTAYNYVVCFLTEAYVLTH